MITSAYVVLEYSSEGRCKVKRLDASALAGWAG